MAASLRVCAWCGKTLGTKETTDGAVTHGMCDGCQAKMLDDMAAYKKRLEAQKQTHQK